MGKMAMVLVNDRKKHLLLNHIEADGQYQT